MTAGSLKRQKNAKKRWDEKARVYGNTERNEQIHEEAIDHRL